MDKKQQPEALRLAAMLTADEWPGSVTLVSYARECVAELLRQHAENETLRAGYAAARLEVESLKAQLHAAKKINAAQFRLLAASIPGSALRASHGQAPAGAGEPTEQQILEAAFAPAQPAPEASRFGSPELQAMIIARCVEKDQADSVPAVSDLPPLPAPDLRDVGTKPQEIKEFLKGYATEYARTAIAARAPADSVQEDAAWMPLTPELLTAIESGDLGNRFWIAAHNNNEPQIGVYEWRQGRNPHGFNSDLSRYGASEITHVLPYKPPALPAASKQGATQ